MIHWGKYNWRFWLYIFNFLVGETMILVGSDRYDYLGMVIVLGNAIWFMWFSLRRRTYKLTQRKPVKKQDRQKAGRVTIGELKGIKKGEYSYDTSFVEHQRQVQMVLDEILERRGERVSNLISEGDFHEPRE